MPRSPGRRCCRAGPAVTYSPTWRETPKAEPGCWGWARTGVPSYEYQSLEARAAAIDAGADRPAATSTQDVCQTADAFAAAATGMPSEAWQRGVRYTAGQEPRADATVPSRLAEALIHHVDLDLCYRPQDWPAWFTTGMLSRTATALTETRKMTSPVRLAGTDTGQHVCNRRRWT